MTRRRSSIFPSYIDPDLSLQECYLKDLVNYRFYDEILDDDSVYSDVIDDIFNTSRRQEGLSPEKKSDLSFSDDDEEL